MRSIVAKNADSQATLSKMRIDYPKAYSLTELKSSAASAEKPEA